MINKDRAYCASKTCEGKCGRQLTKTQKQHADIYNLELWYGIFCDEDGEPYEKRN